MIYSCCDQLRRSVVAGAEGWNGIDFIEVVDRLSPVEADRQRFLTVHFVKALGALSFVPANVRIEGGERVQNIRVLSVTAGAGPNTKVLKVDLDRPGDFSMYTLRLVKDVLNDEAPSGIDPQLSLIEFSFKVECPSPFDCAPQCVCLPESLAAPQIDYLARDYGTFRRLMLDRIAALVPSWAEGSPADLTIALIEALAYTADQLSYQLDAVATEAYLRTARRRVSARRHARLMDYFISEGCNARTWIHFEVSADAASSIPGEPLIPQGTKILTRIAGQSTVIADDAKIYEHADAGFETIARVEALYKDHNELHFYTWSDQRCCLQAGATAATLDGHHPDLAAGAFLMFEEALGPETGIPADADVSHRHVVRLSSVISNAPDYSPLTDPVTGVPITEIRWTDDDALPFPLCVSAQTAVGYKTTVTVARGNLVTGDHGITVRAEPLGAVPAPFLFQLPVASGGLCETAQRTPVFPRFRPRLSQTPLTHSGPPLDETLSARAVLQWSLRDVNPAVTLTSAFNGKTEQWAARRDLLNSEGNAEEFVAEIDYGGSVAIRFGDGSQGKRPEPGTQFTATYRVGNGRSGNIGADTLAHIAASIPEIVGLRNPLPAQGGQDPEFIEDVRQRAPVAYRVQERAVTPADYAEVAERHPDVQRAAATFRWTGSWHTVFLTADRKGGLSLQADFEQTMQTHVEQYRMVGYDVEVDSPRFVSLELVLRVCVADDHFRSDVERELLDALSSRDLPSGGRGLFHPDNFTFGQSVYLSAVYAAAHSVAGVVSVEALTIQRWGVPDSNALDTGYLKMDRLEIARLDNDPNFAERGSLKLTFGGGK